jgi:Xaa-Pro aminopeptidase
VNLVASNRAHRVPATRWHTIPQMLQDQHIDVLVASSPENVTYTSGHYEYTLSIIRDRIAATVIPAEGDPVYLVVDRIGGAARAHSWIKEIATYSENSESPMKVLAGIISEKRLAGATIAVEEEFLTTGYFDELRGYLPQARFCDASVPLARTRSVKTDEEVAFIAEAVQATETAHLKVFRTLHAGDTEIQIARAIRAQMLLEGADFAIHGIVAAGRNTMEGHHVTDDTPIRVGDVVQVDNGGVFAGYLSDISRQLVVGQPSSRQRSMWRKLRDVQRQGVDAMRVGVRACDAYKSLRDQKGNEDIWFYGHSLGVLVHDTPMLTEHYRDGLRTTTNLSTTWELEPNMLVMVELGLTDRVAGQQYTFEDLVLVTEKGPKILSNVMDTTEMFVVE